jgi:hypothetical protein
MQCLKCGKKTSGKQVFCAECLAVMQDYPVKPGIPVHLPQRGARTLEKKQADDLHEPTPSQQLHQLRILIRWLLGIIAVLSVILLLTAGMLIHTLEQDTGNPAIGKNYTTTDSATKP